MTELEEYKPCPACGHRNPPHERVCRAEVGGETCGEVLLNVPVVRREPPIQPVDPTWSESSLSLRLTASGESFAVRDGQTLGRKDPASRAEIQIDGLPAYVHREHCAFECREGRWYVRPLDRVGGQGPADNPTFLDGRELEAGRSYPLDDRGSLALCDIEFRVEIRPQ